MLVKSMLLQDLTMATVGDSVIHNAEAGQQWAGTLVDIGTNQLYGFVQYQGGPHDQQEQWVPRELLTTNPNPPAKSETPVRDAMKEAGKEALANEVAVEPDRPLVEAEPAPEPAPEPEHLEQNTT